MPLSYQVVGLDDLVKDAKKQGEHSVQLVHAAIVNATNKIQSNTRKRAPHLTGTLQRSILTDVSSLQGIVQVQEKYGEYVEYGTGIYGKSGRPITASAGKVLYFKVAGQPVFAKSVKGQKAQPFFKPGILESATYIDEQFVKVAEILVRKLAGK